MPASTCSDIFYNCDSCHGRRTDRILDVSARFPTGTFCSVSSGGSLGRRLLSKVKNEMVLAEKIPFVESHTCFKDVVSEITKGELGLVLVHHSSSLPFLITDGDVRRAMEMQEEQVFKLVALDIASTLPKTISENANIETAYNKMSKYNVSSLLVVSESKFVGILKK